eukprot:2096739-Amphidinium_carterae.1
MESIAADNEFGVRCMRVQQKTAFALTCHWHPQQEALARAPCFGDLKASLYTVELALLSPTSLTLSYGMNKKTCLVKRLFGAHNLMFLDTRNCTAPKLQGNQLRRAYRKKAQSSPQASSEQTVRLTSYI